MNAQSATVRKQPYPKSFGKKPVQDSPQDTQDSQIAVPGLSNDNADDYLAPDWSIFSADKLHPLAGKAQIVMTVLGLALGLAYAFVSLGATGVGDTLVMSIFSYLTYGLVGTVGGYFGVWIIGGAVILSPVLLIAALFV